MMLSLFRRDKKIIEEKIEIKNMLKKTLFEYLTKYNLPSDLAHATKDRAQTQSIDKKVLEKLKSLGY